MMQMNDELQEETGQKKLEGYFWKSYKSLRCYLFPFLRELKSPRKKADRDALIVCSVKDLREKKEKVKNLYYKHSLYVFFINKEKCFP
jgi:hypothetical protein